jgi:hypothetical protein
LVFPSIIRLSGNQIISALESVHLQALLEQAQPADLVLVPLVFGSTE